MENVRLIYEQIGTAKGHLLAGDSLNCRLSFILLDNVAELLMARTLRDEFAFEDFFYPPHHPRLCEAQRPKYTAEERKHAEREFEPKLRILGFRTAKISPEDCGILKVCHRLRSDAFHTGALHRTILSQSATLLFQTTVALTLKLPIRSFCLPGPRPTEADARFLAGFNLDHAERLALDEGREHMAQQLLDGITLDVASFAETLSTDLTTRIDENVLGGLAYLRERNADIDRSLQHGQFWQERGASLAQAGVRQPHLDQAFDEWRAQGRARYTVPKINRWRRQAELIARRTRPSAALEQWWAINEAMRALEAEIGKTVDDYDDRINAEIHDRRH